MDNIAPTWGETAPWFSAEVANGSCYKLENMAGRFVVLVFLGSCTSSRASIFLNELQLRFPEVDQRQVLIFGLTNDRAKLADTSILKSFPRGRLFLDENNKIATRYGLIPESSGPEPNPYWFVLDPTLRIWTHGTLKNYDHFFGTVTSLPSPAGHSGTTSEPWAPVLCVPRVLSSKECQRFIDYYQDNTPRLSGFMVNENGMTRERHNSQVKSRSDVNIEEADLQAVLRQAIKTRLAPEIERAFQFKATRIERFIVACYRAEDGGRFQPHRDNTTAATAHRNFAVTINLNAEDYEGGELRFPEFGARTYSAPTGGAIVFSCSLLHEALPVTMGNRYATLPFLYGEKEAKMRDENRKYLAQD